jgi:cation:H+ antiporter
MAAPGVGLLAAAPSVELGGPMAIAVFIAAAVTIFIVGPKLAKIAEKLAIITGLGQALSGAVLLGLSTSLGGTVVSVTAAARGDAELAVSNALGGIAAQTAFLAIADGFLPKTNLEHAAASTANLFQVGLVIALLALIMTAFTGPEVAVLGLHPVSYLLPVAWLAGTILARRAQDDPAWLFKRTAETHVPEDDGDSAKQAIETPAWKLWALFAVFASLTIASGIGLSLAAPTVGELTGLSTSAVGALFTAVVTSLPELVTTVAAVRSGALVLAVGDIVGGNAFDTLFIALSDAVYRDGSILHAASGREQFLTALGILVSGVLLMGLVGRERRGPGKIGTESVLILILYAVGMGVLVWMG